MELFNKVNEYNSLLKDGVISGDQFQKLKKLLYTSIAGEDGGDDIQTIENTINDGVYKEATALVERKTKDAYEEAIPALEYLGDWQNAPFLLQQCKNEIHKIEAEEEEYRIEQARLQAEELATVATLETSTSKRICPNCGTETNGRFCPECGTAIPDNYKAKYEDRVESQKPKSFVSITREEASNYAADSNNFESFESININDVQSEKPQKASKKTFAIIGAAIAAVVLIILLATSGSNNSGEPTIESYVANDSATMQEIQNEASSAGLEIAFDGNTVIYTYDLSDIEGVTEEVAKSDYMIRELASSLESTSGTFVDLCKQLENESQISGVQIAVNYSYGNEVLVTKTFNSSGVVE